MNCDAQARCPIPIDAHAHLRILDLQIGGDILQVGQPPQCRFELRGVVVERVDVGALQCELILRLGRPAADADGCRNLEIGPNSRHIIELRGQLPDHLISGQPVAARLQPNAHTALVHRAPADRRHEMRHVRIAAQDVGDRELMVAHVLVGAALQRFRRALDLAGVFRGNESFGNQLEQHSGRDQNHPGEDEGEPAAVHHPSQRALVPRQGALVHALRGVVKASVPLFLRRTEEAAAQHRRQRQRDESRDQDRDADRHGEFVEQAADDAAQEQDGNEYRGERQRHGQDRKPDLTRAVERRLQRLFSLLQMADNVLEHHDRIVHDKPDRQRERHERQVVEAVAHQIHHRKRADDREWQRETRNDRRRQILQEQEDDEHDETERDQQRQLHVIHGLANRDRPVIQRVHFDRRG